MKRFIAYIVVIGLCQCVRAQNLFQKTFGYLGSDYGFSIQQTADGGFIITGETNSFGAGSTDVILFKTDINGAVSWEKTYGGASIDKGSSVQQTSDGGYIITGNTYSFGAGFGDVYLIKTDANGDTIWTKTYGGLFDDGAYSVQQTSDGGYIMTGFTISFGAGDLDVYLIKTDSVGTLEWAKTFGGTDEEQGMEVKQTIDGGYIIVSYTRSFGFGGTCGSFPCSDVYLIKTDLNGAVEWTKTYSGTGMYNNDDGRSIQQTADSGYVIIGTTYIDGGARQDVYLLKVDANGNVEWAKTYGGSIGREFGYSGQQTFDKGYIIIGITQNSATSPYDVFLIKTDSVGTVEWSKKFGGTGEDFGYSVQQIADESYIITGNTKSFGAGIWDIYLIKTDNNGNSGGCNQSNAGLSVGNPTVFVGSGGVVDSGGIANNTATIVGNIMFTDSLLCDTTTGVYEKSAYHYKLRCLPNPFSNYTTLEAYVPEEVRNAEIVVYNLLGILIKRYPLKKGDNTITVSAGDLTGGIYFYALMGDERMLDKGKMAVVR